MELWHPARAEPIHDDDPELCRFGSHDLDVGGYYNTALTPGPGDPQSRSPYPYIVPTFYDRSIGSGNYNALQFSLDHRYNSGLGYQVRIYVVEDVMPEATGGLVLREVFPPILTTSRPTEAIPSQVMTLPMFSR